MLAHMVLMMKARRAKSGKEGSSDIAVAFASCKHVGQLRSKVPVAAGQSKQSITSEDTVPLSLARAAQSSDAGSRFTLRFTMRYTHVRTTSSTTVNACCLLHAAFCMLLACRTDRNQLFTTYLFDQPGSNIDGFLITTRLRGRGDKTSTYGQGRRTLHVIGFGQLIATLRF